MRDISPNGVLTPTSNRNLRQFKWGNLRVLLILVVMIQQFSAHSQVTAISNVNHDVEAAIDQIFSEYSSPNRPGGSVAVVRDGELIFAKGYGSANLEY